jgi:alkylhydroperoxidase family enzyme
MPRIEPVPFQDLPDEVQDHIVDGRRRGVVSGDSMPIFAHSPYVAMSIIDSSKSRAHPGRLGGRLTEMMRIRSAQLGACGPCSIARKDPAVTDDDVACLLDPEHMGLPRREVLAIQIVDLMATDHDAITTDTLQSLSQEFDTEEIVELLYRAGSMIGSHRFVHVLDVLGDGEPVLKYTPETVRASWERAYGQAVVAADS